MKTSPRLLEFTKGVLPPRKRSVLKTNTQPLYQFCASIEDLPLDDPILAEFTQTDEAEGMFEFQTIKNDLKDPKPIKSLVVGDDILKYIKPSPEVGEYLWKAYKIQMENPEYSKKYILDLLFYSKNN